MKYKAPLDNLAKAITLGVTLITIFIIVFVIRLESTAKQNDFISYLVIGALLLGYLFSLLFRTVGYEVEDNRLIIHRPVKNVVIRYDDISDVKLLDKKILTRSIRTLGVGGLYGYFGKYNHMQIGPMILYATKRSNAVLISTNDFKQIVITPENAEEFLLEFRRLYSYVSF